MSSRRWCSTCSSTFIVLSLINPYRVEESEENLQMSNLHEGQSFFEMLGEYILAGFKVAIIVAAMLIGFIALISALNALFATVTGWFGYSISFQGSSAISSTRLPG